MSRRVIIKCKHGLRAEAIRVFVLVVSVSVMSPMLSHPIPFIGSNKVRSESKQIIDPWVFGCCTVIGIMLDVQPNESLCNTKWNSQEYSTLVPVVVVEECGGGGEGVLHKEEECYVAKCSEEEAGCTKLTTSANNLEDFLLDFTFKGRIELVAMMCRQWNKCADWRWVFAFCNEHVIFYIESVYSSHSTYSGI